MCLFTPISTLLHDPQLHTLAMEQRHGVESRLNLLLLFFLLLQREVRTSNQAEASTSGGKEIESEHSALWVLMLSWKQKLLQPKQVHCTEESKLMVDLFIYKVSARTVQKLDLGAPDLQ